MKTDMTFREMKGLIGYLSQGVPKMESLYLEGSDSWEGGYYYILNDQSLIDTKQALQGHIGVALDRNGNPIEVEIDPIKPETDAEDSEDVDTETDAVSETDLDEETTTSNNRY